MELDKFDHHLLDLLQKDDTRTADSLARDVPLSPSAIARRLRHLRSNGSIARTIAILGPKITSSRLRAVITLQLKEHADSAGKSALVTRIRAVPQVQLCYELAGTTDMLLILDCANMAEFNALAQRVLVADDTVKRYETSFVKEELKFEPFVAMQSGG
jgi:DNA-binding Lrp family transcriptional regulator